MRGLSNLVGACPVKHGVERLMPVSTTHASEDLRDRSPVVRMKMKSISSFIVLGSLVASSTSASAQVLLHTLEEPQGVLFGFHVGAPGDVNLDGVPDVIVGDPSYGANGPNSGAAFIYSGVDGALIWTFLGDQQGDTFGDCVSGAGDVDADGYEDVVVGASGGGYVRVFSGTDGSVLYTHSGESFGYSVSGAGDVNSDGHDDLFAGAPFRVRSGIEFGSGWIFSGRDGSVLRRLDGARGLGWSARGPLDFNHDGSPDLLISAAKIPWSGEEGGSVIVYSSRDDSILLVIRGTEPEWMLGIDVASADVDGDGTADVITSSWKYVWHHGDYDTRVLVYSGADGSLIHELQAATTWDWLGLSVDGLDDRDGDGFDEFLVGEPGALGYGGGGFARIHSGRDGSVLQEFTSAGFSHSFGASVRSIGDVTGDGSGDFLFGSPLQSLSYIYSGDCLGPFSYCSTSPNSAGAGALMGSQGLPSIAANELVLTIQGGVPGRYGLFFYGPQQAHIPLGDGILCVAAGGLGLFRLSPAQLTDGAGQASFWLDFTKPPANGGDGQITPGSTWNFQFWYRDPAAGGSGFNLSDGLAVTFCP